MVSYTKGEVAAWNAVQALPRSKSEPHMAILENVELVRWAADSIELATVRDMRRLGWTWAEVGEAFGVTHQAARQRWKARGVE